MRSPMSRRTAAIGLTAAAAVALATAAASSGAVFASPAHGAAYPAPQQMLPKQVQFLSGVGAAPGPAYRATSRRFTPVGIQGSYGLKSLYAEGLTGAGKTIAIVDSFGYPTAGADLEQFSKDYGLPLMCGMPDVTCAPGMGTFSTLSIGSRTVQSPPDTSKGTGIQASNAWSVEVALDIEYAHTTAPGANILLVSTPNAETLGMPGLPNMMNAEQQVVDQHLADVVSQSFGTAEGAFGSTQSLLSLRHAFTSGTAAGITFLASSGDNGSTGSSLQPVKSGGTLLPTPEVGWPASDPLVTAVGGTTLCTDVFTGVGVVSDQPPADCQNNTGVREIGWNGSGGGFSHVFARPSYQENLPAGSTAIPAAARGVPDISMDASCTSYVIVLDTAPGYGGYYGVCGTSAASPMFAGVVALADQAAGHDLGLINPRLYQMAASGLGDIFDVTIGNNTQAGSGIPGYADTTGWDAVTGLGTPADGSAFVHALAGS